MGNIAQGHDGAVGEGDRLRQTSEPRRDPSSMPFGKCSGLAHVAARRHGEHDFARRRMDAKRVTSRAAMTAEPHEIHRFVEDELDGLWLARPAIEQRAQRHDVDPGKEGPDSRFCPYPRRRAALLTMPQGLRLNCLK